MCITIIIRMHTAAAAAQMNKKAKEYQAMGDKLLRFALRHDDTQILVSLYSNHLFNMPPLDVLVVHCVKAGAADCLYWRMLRSGYSDATDWVAACGHLWAHETDACTAAAAGGHLKMLKLLRDRQFAWNAETLTTAAKHGSLPCLQFLRESGCPCDDLGACGNAATGGFLDCLRYLRESGCRCDHSTCRGAALGGSLPCLKYLHKSGCLWEEDTCSEAAYCGQFKCLVYAHEHGCAWTSETCANAARGSNLDCLRYAHQNGCPWDEQTCYYAAQDIASADCLMYARNNGCPWDVEACYAAANNAQLRLLLDFHRGRVPRRGEPAAV